ncbi:MAG: ABC transporter ATP-binding protein [Oscillospiraceae bacterium]|nr:ABC transporter ATP-binding protein [Oscillospiraceae bacterium]MDD4368011.1 ABC transporter ATP-binding protein [Oscillospiraceae bacterium]
MFFKAKQSDTAAALSAIVPDSAILEVRDLSVYYGAIHALKGISFFVRPGEIVSLIGSNGAGKTTTLQTISGLLTPREGDILYRGKVINKVPSHKILQMGLAQVPEGRRMFTQISVEDNLLMGAYCNHNKKQVTEDLQKMFTQFPRLKDRRTQRAGTLSGGEQQMLAIARALMSHPQLLLLDEPSMGLSPVLTKEIMHIIQRVASEGTTVLLVEQNASMALSLADRAYVMETGRLTITGSGSDLLHDPRVIKAYLGG